MLERVSVIKPLNVYAFQYIDEELVIVAKNCLCFEYL
jgi:hypothetical protein